MGFLKQTSVFKISLLFTLFFISSTTQFGAAIRPTHWQEEQLSRKIGTCVVNEINAAGHLFLSRPAFPGVDVIKAAAIRCLRNPILPLPKFHLKNTLNQQPFLPFIQGQVCSLLIHRKKQWQSLEEISSPWTSRFRLLWKSSISFNACFNGFPSSINTRLDSIVAASGCCLSATANANCLVVLNALTDMYAKCGDIVKARRIALLVFRGMIQEGFEPDPVTISNILSSFCSLKTAAQIHGWVLRRGIEWNTSVVNAMIVVYSNLGKLDGASWLFQRMPKRDIMSWNSIFSGHSKHPEALLYFKQMVRSGTSPDSITFVAIVSACAHLGLVKDGERLFWLMRKKYGIDPRMEHYACMVNLYESAGL
ncbi:hypothetical protein CXB51_034726 [Gossypium anomalum]|uniref:Pentatricopeptide repeat-containing protein n=1 Tax=Gossypium anomalum TaxID=47600 RepID=A0A8J5XXV2_9ROSI|nr:hypothetical protein CXB51_034726 [Gossypium anomalum]